MVERRGMASYGGTSRQSVLRETLLAGLIGAAVVAAWFLIIDIARGQLWFTPAALGSAVFLGARDLADVQVTPGVIIGYTLLHIAAFLAIAFFAVKIMRAAEFEPRAWLGVVLLFVVMEVFVLGMLAILASWLLESISLWMVAAANVLAALGMGTFLWKAHPAMREDLRVNVEEAQ